MAWYNEDTPEKLNFMVAGNNHSGYGLLQSALAAHPSIICHGDILHEDDKVRRKEHEAYFGPSGKVADHFVPTHLSLEQYLNNKIFDNTLYGEKAVGVKINYRSMLQYDLWEYIDQKYRCGDFCILHVVRNPVACYISWKQRQGHEGLAAQAAVNAPMYVDPCDLTAFVRDHVSAMLKINKLCPDRVVVPYHELLLNFRQILERIFEFIELDFNPVCIPNRRRVHHKDIKARIANWFQVREAVPPDVLEFVDCPSLF
jgi:hypothetical protein